MHPLCLFLFSLPLYNDAISFEGEARGKTQHSETRVRIQAIPYGIYGTQSGHRLGFSSSTLIHT